MGGGVDHKEAGAVHVVQCAPLVKREVSHEKWEHELEIKYIVGMIHLDFLVATCI